jgi:hypothetical protein
VGLGLRLGMRLGLGGWSIEFWMDLGDLFDAWLDLCIYMYTCIYTYVEI